VRPFTNIRDAEARHIGALRSLFERYGLPMPPNPWIGRTPHFADTHAAYEAGVEAESANADLYDRLMRSTTRKDILAVFARLRRASQERHLPAFRRGASRGEGPGTRR